MIRFSAVGCLYSGLYGLWPILIQLHSIEPSSVESRQKNKLVKRAVLEGSSGTSNKRFTAKTCAQVNLCTERLFNYMRYISQRLKTVDKAQQKEKIMRTHEALKHYEKRNSLIFNGLIRRMKWEKLDMKNTNQHFIWTNAIVSNSLMLLCDLILICQNRDFFHFKCIFIC